MQDDHRHIPVEIKIPAKYAKGGLATAAKDVASAGEGGDTMLVHVNKAEFEMLRKQWGDPQINDKTGLPSYSWGDWLGPLAGVIGGVTGFGGDLGGAITGALGADVSPAVSSALGSALIGGGLGALGGGGRGALYGGLAGGAAGYLGGGNNMLSGLFGGAGGNLTGAAADNFVGKMGDAAQGPTLSGATADMNGGSTGAGASGGSSGLGSLLSGNSKYGYTPLLMAGLVAANAFGQNRGPSADSKAAAANTAAAQAKFNAPLPQVNFNRTLSPLQGDPRRYGFGPTQNRFSRNGLGYARGGSVAPRGALSAPAGLPNQQQSGTVSGPGTGRSDAIPARLSDGEFVFDAETTALLGDGSSKAGAAKLDALRQNVRKHKGGALAQGRISPNAKSPEAYMTGRKA